MALSCNSFSENTVLITQQEANCKQSIYNMVDQGLPQIQISLLILDMLERLGIGPDISAIPMCDANEAFRAATCAILPLTTPGNMEQDKVDSLILYKLNEALCA